MVNKLDHEAECQQNYCGTIVYSVTIVTEVRIE